MVLSFAQHALVWIPQSDSFSQRKKLSVAIIIDLDVLNIFMPREIFMPLKLCGSNKGGDTDMQPCGTACKLHLYRPL
jgi:hypothetical protein